MIFDDTISELQSHTFIYLLKKNKLGIIYQARQYLGTQILINLYNTFILPLLIYCLEIWGNACDSHLNPIIKLQKKIIRIITFSAYKAHTVPLFDTLKILPFKKLVVQRIGLQMYKYSRNTLPEAVMDLFHSNNSVHNYNTRQKHNLRHPLGKHEYMYRSFTFIAVYIWNHIISKSNIDILAPYSRFKNILKDYLLKNDISFRIT